MVVVPDLYALLIFSFRPARNLSFSSVSPPRADSLPVFRVFELGGIAVSVHIVGWVGYLVNFGVAL